MNRWDSGGLGEDIAPSAAKNLSAELFGCVALNGWMTWRDRRRVSE
jgi:hypothetical protein